jgi:hypothetical protein
VIRISTALNDYRLNAVLDFLSIGAANARVLIHEGQRPALGAPPEGNLLAAIVLLNPMGEVKEGLLTMTATGESLIQNSGQAAWARIVNGDGQLAWDCDVSDMNGAGELRLPSTTLYAGGYTRIVSGLLG